jgi:predicted dithiol-disulfide oxidoreductase (DUF899 family)
VSSPRVGTRAEWTAERVGLLAREKQLNRLRDELAEQRRLLPWVRLDKDYRFDGPDGPRSLPELFDGRRQLLVYQFMFGPDCCSVVNDTPKSKLKSLPADENHGRLQLIRFW